MRRREPTFSVTHCSLHCASLDKRSHPGSVLGCWLRDYARQVRLLTSGPAVERANNVSEQGAMAAKRH
jgi:hypothetical protein